MLCTCGIFSCCILCAKKESAAPKTGAADFCLVCWNCYFKPSLTASPAFETAPPAPLAASPTASPASDKASLAFSAPFVSASSTLLVVVVVLSVVSVVYVVVVGISFFLLEQPAKIAAAQTAISEIIIMLFFI